MASMDDQRWTNPPTETDADDLCAVCGVPMSAAPGGQAQICGHCRADGISWVRIEAYPRG
jgi:nitrous oxide reductase accessory protein NosL